jgi:hypothetical protein
VTLETFSKKGILMPEGRLVQTLSASRTWQNNMNRSRSIDIATLPTVVNGSFPMRPESICEDMMVTFSWSDSGNTLWPHRIESHVQVDGKRIMFWCCIVSKSSGYGTTIIDG